MRIPILGLAALALGCGACGRSPESEPPVTTYENDDKEFQAAIQEARRTLDRFITCLQNPKPEQSEFFIKIKFDLGEGKGEHIWVSDVRYSGTEFSGKIGNKPRNVKNLSEGSPITAGRDRITDWMFVENGRLVGGTTMRLARKRKSAADREAFDLSVPFKFD